MWSRAPWAGCQSNFRIQGLVSQSAGRVPSWRPDGMRIRSTLSRARSSLQILDPRAEKIIERDHAHKPSFRLGIENGKRVKPDSAIRRTTTRRGVRRQTPPAALWMQYPRSLSSLPGQSFARATSIAAFRVTTPKATLGRSRRPGKDIGPVGGDHEGEGVPSLPQEIPSPGRAMIFVRITSLTNRISKPDQARIRGSNDTRAAKSSR